MARDDDTELARSAIQRVEALLEAAGCPLDIAALGVNPAQFDQIAASSVQATRLVLNNPAPMTEESVKALLARAMAADRGWWDRP